MTSHRVPLWAAGVASWPLVVSSFPVGDSRAFAWALVAGGCVAIPLIAVDYTRGRRAWLAALVVWATIFWFMPASTLVGSDQNVEMGLFVALLVLVFGAPVFAIVLLADAWAHRRRSWRVGVEGSKAVFSRRRGGA